jgi:tryptophan-rich sensory protein
MAYIFAAAPLIIGSLIGALTAPSSGKSTSYKDLKKPSWTPPAWVFGPVWTFLYILTGMASVPVFNMVMKGGKDAQEARMALGVYIMSLIVNFAWSPVFFGFQRPDLALILIVLLLGLIIWTIYLFARLGERSWILLIPYLVWVAYAMTLNAEIVVNIMKIRNHHKIHKIST